MQRFQWPLWAPPPRESAHALKETSPVTSSRRLSEWWVGEAAAVMPVEARAAVRPRSCDPSEVTAYKNQIIK